MILHREGYCPEELPAMSAKVGRRFDSIELNAEDFQRLASLRPDMLHEWLIDWMCGFPPPKRSRT